MEIYLARVQGFCAGVASAIKVVDKALEKYGTPLYVLHEIVHNTAVVESFKKRGVTFVEELDKIPQGSCVIFSAHGVAPSVIEKAKEMNLRFINATCPLVTKVHKRAQEFSSQEIETVLIGHKNHQEIIGTSGYVRPELLHIIENESDIDGLNIDASKTVGYLTQTTLSMADTEKIVEKLRGKFKNLINPQKSDICYATQSRQDAVKELSKICDIIIICGSQNSSNSNRLRETAQNQGVASYLVDKADDLDINVLNSKKCIGVSSGASVPRFVVEELIDRVKSKYPIVKIHALDDGKIEHVFPTPAI